MAAGAFTFYHQFAELVADGTQDLDTHAFKLALFTSAHTPSTADTTFSALTNQVAAGNGYTAGGETLATVTWAQTSGVAKFDAADVVWTATGGSITARYAVLYNSTVAAAGDLVGYFLLDSTPADVTATDGNTLTVQWHADGIFTLSVV
jgi:hypothetical protein